MLPYCRPPLPHTGAFTMSRKCSTKSNPIKFITSNGNVNENKLPYQSSGHPRPDSEGLSLSLGPGINLRNYPVRMIIGEGSIKKYAFGPDWTHTPRRVIKGPLCNNASCLVGEYGVRSCCDCCNVIALMRSDIAVAVKKIGYYLIRREK